MIAHAQQFASAAIAAGLMVTPLYTVDPTLPHETGEPAALVAVGGDGLVYGGFSPHFEEAPWFVSGVGLDLASEADANVFYASLC